MADECLPLVEKRYKETKFNVPKPQSSSSADGMMARQTHTAVHSKSVKEK